MLPRIARGVFAIGLACLTVLTAADASADTLEYADGTVQKDCFVRDEGIRYLVWDKMADVGSPPRIVPRSKVKKFKIERGEAWDVHPALPDLTVTFIEMNPKRAGLHGRVHYDSFGRPSLGGAKALVDLGKETVMKPRQAASKLKLQYAPGEEITLTAHVKNVGFRTAKGFRYVWKIDDKQVSEGSCAKSLKEMEETTFPHKHKWQTGRHTVTFQIRTDQREISTINNVATDPMWGWGFWFYVTPGRVKAWHENRTAVGTFCFGDHYRWHVDLMNTLFAASVFPSATKGIKARVRLDRILYVDDIGEARNQHSPKDGIAYHQGAWIWQNDEDKDKKWKAPDKNWRNATEWSLPHELGHQLGLTDWYFLDYEGTKDHVWPDTGDKISHFQTHPVTMMHWHGPHVWSEVDAGYLNMTWDKPRGHFGDYYFAIPAECFLRVVDVNGLALPGAKVEIFQRGTEVDPKGKPTRQKGVSFYPVIEDGNFNRPVSKAPVIVGATDAGGMMRLPNRPVKEVVTLNGYHRRANPFGNINVVGQRGLMLVKITRDGRPTWYWLEIYNFNVAWFRGQKDKYVTVLRTPYGSASSPVPPRSVKASAAGKDKVRVTWDAPEIKHEQQYLERAIGYRVYRRIGTMGLNDRPWFPVATVKPAARECLVDLTDKPYDIEWYSRRDRFAVSSVGELGMESELVEVVLPSGK